MKITEHLMFLALMVPTFLLLVIAAVILAQPAHPSTGQFHNAVAAAAGPAPAHGYPVDERRYEAPY